MPVTWEGAAREAAAGVPEGLMPADGFSPLEEIEWFLNDMRDVDAEVAGFEYICDNALQMVEANNGGPTECRESAVSRLLSTLASKQHDYGHENVTWGGVEGVILRMHDKCARIRNLTNRAEQTNAVRTDIMDPLNESLADSWLDIAGYAIIGIMLLNDTFKLPLAADIDGLSFERQPDGSDVIAGTDWTGEPFTIEMRDVTYEPADDEGKTHSTATLEVGEVGWPRAVHVVTAPEMDAIQVSWSSGWNPDGKEYGPWLDEDQLEVYLQILFDAGRVQFGWQTIHIVNEDEEA